MTRRRRGRLTLSALVVQTLAFSTEGFVTSPLPQILPLDVVSGVALGVVVVNIGFDRMPRCFLGHGVLLSK
jgi:hypothetical protein